MVWGRVYVASHKNIAAKAVCFLVFIENMTVPIISRDKAYRNFIETMPKYNNGFVKKNNILKKFRNTKQC